MNYVITRGYTGGRLTPAQRTSSLFAEEPVVLGKVLRRGSRPMEITPEQFEAHKAQLLRLAKAGSIVITEPDKTPLTEQEIATAEAEIKAKEDTLKGQTHEQAVLDEVAGFPADTSPAPVEEAPAAPVEAGTEEVAAAVPESVEAVAEVAASSDQAPAPAAEGGGKRRKGKKEE